MLGPFSGTVIPGTGTLFPGSSAIPNESLFTDVKSYSVEKVFTSKIPPEEVKIFLRHYLVQNGDGTNFFELEKNARLIINFGDLEVSNEHFFEGLNKLLKDVMFKEVDTIAFFFGKFHPVVWTAFIDMLKKFPTPLILEFVTFEVPESAFLLLYEAAEKREISPRGYAFQDTGFSDLSKIVFNLSKLFASSKESLEIVQLAGVGLGDEGMQILRALKGAPKLLLLNLSKNLLTDRCVPLLVEVITSCPLLTDLILEGNEFTDVGARGLTVAMTEANKDGMKVDLSGHKKITDLTAGIFFRMAPSVTRLGLNNCGLTTTRILNGITEVEFFKTSGKRRPIEKVSIRGNPIKEFTLQGSIFNDRSVKKIRVDITKFPELQDLEPIGNLFDIQVYDEQGNKEVNDFFAQLRAQLGSPEVSVRRNGLKALVQTCQNSRDDGNIKSLEDSLFEILLKLEFAFKEISRDGNCFFNGVFEGLVAIFNEDLKKTFVNKVPDQFKTFFGNNEHYHALRLSVVQHMVNNRNDYEPFFVVEEEEIIAEKEFEDEEELSEVKGIDVEKMNFDEHCKLMKKDRQWAGDHERRAIQEFLNSIGMNVSLVIYDPRKNPVIGDDGKLKMPEELSAVKSDSKVIHLYRSTDHYTLMLPKVQ